MKKNFIPIPEYTKLAAFSVDTLKNAFSLYEIFQKSGTGNYTAAVIQLARAFEQEMEDRIFGDFKKSCNTLHPFSSKEEILLENYSLNINNDDGNLFVRYFKKFLNEKFHYERIGNNEFAASIIELKELRNKAAHKGTHFNEEQGKLVWKKMTYFFHDWTRALKV
ncbi:MAG: hypothetical protein IPG24_20645 [Leptospiraceae bacterium]|nr:hypothetical protein [Leptospiraceae bacterium]